MQRVCGQQLLKCRFCVHFLICTHLNWMWGGGQVETPLELAAGLSLSLDNRLFLKREDLQPVLSSIPLLFSDHFTQCCLLWSDAMQGNCAHKKF